MIRWFFTLVLVGILSILAPISAIESPPRPPEGSPISQGLWWLYHLQYDRAYAAFDRYIEQNPQDPAGPFYRSAVSWWRLAQELEFRQPEVEAVFEKDYRSTVQTARALYDGTSDAKSRALACLYWGGAEGLKGRWLVTQRQWVKAYFLGKRGNSLLQKSLKLDPTLYDAYLGLGIYDYFTDTLSGVHAVLASMLIRGDKNRGLRELSLAIEKSAHARVEAMFFLIEIYTFEEKQPEKALPLLASLRREFPASPAVHLADITTLYSLDDWQRVLPEAEIYLSKSRQEEPWYRHDGVWPALYCIANAHLFGKKDPVAAEKRLKEILDHAPSESRWRTFALLRMGQICDLREERQDAKTLYHQVLERPDFWGSHKEAKANLKRPFNF